VLYVFVVVFKLIDILLNLKIMKKQTNNKLKNM